MCNVHIQYATYQFSEESKGGGGGIHPLPPSPCGTEKSVVLRGLRPEEFLGRQDEKVHLLSITIDI